MYNFDPKQQSTREVILQKMNDLVCEGSYRKVTMEDVAAAAKISRATIYTHFKDKEDLMAAVIEGMNATDRNVLREIVGIRGAPADRIRKFLETRVMLKVERCRKAKSSLDDLVLVARRRLLALRAETMKIDSDLLSELLVEGKLKGEFEFDNAVSVAESFLLATNCFMPFSLTIEELGDESTLRMRLDAMISMCLKSISRRDDSKENFRHGKKFRAAGRDKPA